MSGPRTVPDRDLPPAWDSVWDSASDAGQDTVTAIPGGADAGDTAGEVVRWAAFSSALVPLVLLWYGTSFAGAAGIGLGLAAATGACRVLLRRSEREAARLRAEEHVPHRGRPHGTERGAHRGGRHPGGTAPVG
ncbi:hypothetical protein ABZ723_01175 [Streptomyces sp. NPDC006700]|uniref:hypothetical protein n=1 Tax=unclassified Streptomyces TaxID=2593676 RepID=UPI0033E78E3D